MEKQQDLQLPKPQTPTSLRLDWIDAAKGIGIFLVVVGHAIAGFRDANIIGTDSAWMTIHFFIYTFHMHLFFFLSGLFFYRRLDDGMSSYAKRLFSKIAWPYFLWSIVQAVLVSKLAHLVNTPTTFDLESAIRIAWLPTAQFWFLYVLFFVLVASGLTLRLLGPRMILPISLVAFAFGQITSFKYPSVNQFCFFFAFFSFGVFARPLLSRQHPSSPVVCLVAGLAFVAWLAFASKLHDSMLPSQSFLAVPAAVFGIIMVIAASIAIHGFRNKALVLAGRHSMSIYILHIMFVAGTRILLARGFDISSPPLTLALAICAGLIGPLACRELAERLRVDRLLGLS